MKRSHYCGVTLLAYLSGKLAKLSLTPADGFLRLNCPHHRLLFKSSIPELESTCNLFCRPHTLPFASFM